MMVGVEDLLRSRRPTSLDQDGLALTSLAKAQSLVDLAARHEVAEAREALARLTAEPSR
jgi:hypothetical protein